MGRSNDIIIPTKTSWLSDPAAQEVCSVIADAGYDVFFVGGCVRNAILDLPESDVDMSTNARPEKVMEIAAAAGLRVVPTGIEHGTVIVLSHGIPFEITTFRRDVETDGRRAVVAFSNDITEDARRRDFTMNALYATRSGVIVDPVGGMSDLLARKVRFIENAEERIREDYLRILRFFRFSAWYADPMEGFDLEALSAIAENTSGLESLSAERIGQEVTKLLMAPDPSPAIATMRQTGVLSTILPGSDDSLLTLLVHMESVLGVLPNWVRRIAVLGGDDVTERLRLSKVDSKAFLTIRDIGFCGPPVQEISYRYGELMGQNALLVRAAIAEQEPEFHLLESIAGASKAKFPVSARDLMPQYQGPTLGLRLKELEQLWINSNFTLTRSELLGLS